MFKPITSTAPVIFSIPDKACLVVITLNPELRISTILNEQERSICIKYANARLFKKYCLNCELLEKRDYLEQDENPLRTCSGYDKTNYCHKNLENIHHYLEYIKVKVPNTLWTYDESRKTWYQYCVRNIKGTIYKIPYRLGNVFDNASICWGSQNKIPKDLSEAINSFWALPFNSDLIDRHHRKYEGDLVTKLTTYDINGAFSDHEVITSSNSSGNINNSLIWSKCTDFFNESSIYTDKDSEKNNFSHVVIWTDDKTLSQLPDSCKKSMTRRPKYGTGKEVIGAVSFVKTLTPNLHYLDFGTFQCLRPKLTSASKITPLDKKL